MSSRSFDVVRDRDKLIVSGFNSPVTKEDWEAIGTSDVVLMRRRDKLGNWASRSATFCTANLFSDYFVGLSERKWSGSISAKTSTGNKNLYVKDGELIFADSDQINDRLGEVLYRNGTLSYSTMEFAAKTVTKDKKFGRVLVEAGKMSEFELWSGLKDQVKHILKSIFLEELVYFELKTNHFPKEISSLVFKSSTKNLIKDCASYGTMFLSFVTSIADDSRVNVVNPFAKPAGSYFKDILERIPGGSMSVAEYIENFPLPRPYILSVLLDLVNLGVFSIEGWHIDNSDFSVPHLRSLVKFLELYENVLNKAKSSFSYEKKDFPVDSIQEMAKFFGAEFPSFYLNNNGYISEVAQHSMLKQCLIEPNSKKYFESRIKCLLEFVGQMAKDLISNEACLDLQQLIDGGVYES